jgi:hypothetical protein
LFAQVQLLAIDRIAQAPFRLDAEQLAAEPVELTLELLDFSEELLL